MTNKIVLFSIFISSILLACNAQKGTATTPVKKIIPMEMKDTDALWQKVDSLEQNGLVRSALDIVEKIKAEAIEAQHSQQMVKAVAYQNKYLVQLEEDAAEQIAQRLEQDIADAPEPAKSVLHSVVATYYANYLRRNFWKMNARTESGGEAPDDMRLWSVGHFLDTIDSHFRFSIAFEGLKQMPVDNYSLILTEDQGTDELRPMLYDILAQRAIDYFIGQEAYLTQPSYRYVLNDPAAFGPQITFSNHNFAAQDEGSKILSTLRLFQAVTKYHVDSDQKKALLDTDLKRLKFVYDNFIGSEKEVLYQEALDRLEEAHRGTAEVTEVWYRQAQTLVNQASRYSADGDTTHQFAYAEALKIINQAIEEYPNSYGTQYCRQLLRRIEQQELTTQVEQVILPNEEILLHLDYRNVNKAWTKIVQIDEDDRAKMLNMRGDDLAPYLNKKPIVIEAAHTLNDIKDHQHHTTEVGIGNPGLGSFVLMTSSESSFKSGQVTMNILHVSSLALFDLREKGSSGNFVITDRASGMAKSNILAEYFERVYQSGRRNYKMVNVGNGRSDQNGFLKANPRTSEQGRSFMLKLTDGNDVLYMDDQFSNYINRSYRQKYKQTQFFADRAIYRPGQTIYFKGYLLEFDEKRMPSIQENKKVTITFHDANGQKKGSLDLRSNEYGTVQGSFQIPAGGLAGQMSLRTNFGNGQLYFQVEEYKRPKFEVTFDDLKEQVKLGDDITVTGKAMNYAGTAVDGAKFTYRVERMQFRPWWRYRGSRWYPQSNDRLQLTYGEGITDADGEFKINFEGKADERRENRENQYYTYQVFVDVVDLSGETRSAEYSLRLGQKSFYLDPKIGDMLPKSELSTIDVEAKTINGEDAQVSGTLEIVQLKIPARSYRDRYWGMPDQNILSQADYNSRFPNYLYPGDEKMENWDTVQSLGKTTFEATGRDSIDLSSQSLQPGAYRLRFVVKNEKGEEATVDRYTIIYDLQKGDIPSYVRYLESKNGTSFEPGETLDYKVSSGANNKPHVLRLTDRQDGQIDKDWLTLSPSASTQVLVAESDRGGFGIGHYFVLNNRFYQYNENIVVPWSNKDLKITYGTFRDKLLPGQDEEWVIKISGPKSDQIGAEMLATMYDASLDAFLPHQWQMNLYPNYYSNTNARAAGFQIAHGRQLSYFFRKKVNNVTPRGYRSLELFGFPMYGYSIRSRTAGVRGGVRQKSERSMDMPGAPPAADAMMMEGDMESESLDAVNIADENDGLENKSADDQNNQKEDAAPSTPKVRTNLDETVFFKPMLQTNEKGEVIIKFKMNEALTRWKFLGLAHTKDLQFKITENEVVTQKELMVFPNLPRFFRQGDKIIFSAKVNNVSDQDLSGNVQLKILDFLSREDLSSAFGNSQVSLPFSIEKGRSENFEWTLNIPSERFNPVLYQVVAEANGNSNNGPTSGAFSDGEEGLIPVISNRMLVTETMPLNVKANQTNEFDFKSMRDNMSSNTLVHHNYAIEFTSNPAWYAVQALPYLMEYPHECSEQIFSRVYANALGSHMANKYPQIKTVFDQWKATDSDALVSNLSKNEELKSALLDETPWVLDAMDETQQKKNIALLFDLNKMGDELETSLGKLAAMQLSNGGFPWFTGGRDNWYITQYILEGYGHLNKLGVNLDVKRNMGGMIDNAIGYVDNRLLDMYQELKRRVDRGDTKWSENHLNRLAIHYLYARSFYMDKVPNENVQKAIDYYMGQAKEYWLSTSVYSQGLLALGLDRRGESTSAQDIVKSLREKSILHDELGRYWKANSGYYWYQLPIERQALMVEVFQELGNDQSFVDELRVWLLKNKQTNRWETTKATTSAIYALLIHDDTWLTSNQLVSIDVGGARLQVDESAVELGSGYFKESWDKSEISASLATIKVTNPNNHIAWGSAYWQYFEDLDKINFFKETPLSITKELYVERSSDTGPKAKAFTSGEKLEPGDKLLVRLIVESDRDMEFIHLKDMRAAGLEPVDVLSQYKWQGGLGYYQSTKDIATHFFFDYLPRGKYVLEYSARASLKGDFSNGISTIQSMYAPEFTGHTAGIRLEIK